MHHLPSLLVEKHALLPGWSGCPQEEIGVGFVIVAVRTGRRKVDGRFVQMILETFEFAIIFSNKASVACTKHPIVQIVEIKFGRVHSKHSLKTENMRLFSDLGSWLMITYPSTHIDSLQFRQLSHTIVMLVMCSVGVMGLVLQELLLIDLEVEIASQKEGIVVDMLVHSVQNRLQLSSTV